MLKEFKEFAMRGNVVDMAVGIIIGVAFGAVIASLVDEVLMPVIGLLLGRVDLSNQFILLEAGTIPGPYASLAAAREAGAVAVGYGMVIGTIVTFLIVAFVLFLVIKGMNAARRPHVPAGPPEPSAEEVLLRQIRDLLAQR
jgi:large conductance mechanosensitive channel